jgi:hypothetical protein
MGQVPREPSHGREMRIVLEEIDRLDLLSGSRS